MPTFREERTGNYTVMSNHHLRNEKLSLKAKGLLSQMLSLPEKWNYALGDFLISRLESLLKHITLKSRKERKL